MSDQQPLPTPLPRQARHFKIKHPGRHDSAPAIVTAIDAADAAITYVDSHYAGLGYPDEIELTVVDTKTLRVTEVKVTCESRMHYTARTETTVEIAAGKGGVRPQTAQSEVTVKDSHAVNAAGVIPDPPIDELIDPGKGYRRLKNGERIRQYDQVKMTKDAAWTFALAIGAIVGDVQRAANKPYRRRIVVAGDDTPSTPFWAKWNDEEEIIGWCHRYDDELERPEFLSDLSKERPSQQDPRHSMAREKDKHRSRPLDRR